ncbi:DUF6301 family protein [Streptomyces niveus]|uniref:DUF6301 family protein n=1 Tax=Streptomyces niveus TaxID=193462 RepID=UPI0036556158
MTWHAFRNDSIRALFEKIRQEDWSWSKREVPALAERFGWVAWPESPAGQLFYKIGVDYRGVVAIFSFDGADVTHLFFTLGVNEGATTPESVESCEVLFTDVHDMVSIILGEPSDWPPSDDMEQEVQWVSGATTVTLTLRVDMVDVRWELTRQVEPQG